MADDSISGLDAVEEGPVSSSTDSGGGQGSTGSPDEHPTLAALLDRYPDEIVRYRLNAGDQYVVWMKPDRSHEILEWLKDDPDHLYDMMSDVTGLDYGNGRPINVVYQMYSTTYKLALRIRCELPLDALEIDSVVDLWQAANWLEREVYDLFGVTFRNHPDHRRILMPDDYAEGHPLRKDFPLRGRFSRAEQTRRALNQNVERFYLAEDLVRGGAPQEVAAAEVGGAISPSESGGGET
ncbi:MAG: NADH-quinone oxidoreductase subunit C [Longimicrobiales bacterium]|nr:NADH-quinone oxidoreductase subunit C [Longimicrobiales bacterium]